MTSETPETREMFCRTGMLLAVILLATFLIPVAGAQQPAGAAIDLAAIVLSPADEGLENYLHAGAFDEALVDEARIAAAYRGTPQEEADYVALLESAGYLRKHLASLQLNSAGDPALVERVVRSYVTAFDAPDGAHAAFVALEDETGATSAEDRQPSRRFGEETDLTADGGFDAENRPFRSLDLTFRVGHLIGGVTLIAYPSESGFEPDQATVEALGAILEARLTNPPPPAIGLSVARLDPAATVTYDDAYYRRDGLDLPLLDESADARDLRQRAYAGAVTVYQLFQGVGAPDTPGGLYSVTLYAFADARAAAGWMAESESLLTLNDYYSNVEPAEPGAINGEETLAYTFGPFGAPPTSRITLARIGSSIVRVQIVPNGTLPTVPLAIAELLTNAQIACLEQGNCVSLPIPPELAAYLTPPVATPAASPASGTPTP